MDEQGILEELWSLLDASGIAIRREPLGGNGGGLCVIKGENILFVDTQASAGEMAMICAEAVPKMVDIETVYIRPEVRQFIENYSTN